MNKVKEIDKKKLATSKPEFEALLKKALVTKPTKSDSKQS